MTIKLFKTLLVYNYKFYKLSSFVQCLLLKSSTENTFGDSYSLSVFTFTVVSPYIENHFRQQGLTYFMAKNKISKRSRLLFQILYISTYIPLLLFEQYLYGSYAQKSQRNQQTVLTQPPTPHVRQNKNLFHTLGSALSQ